MENKQKFGHRFPKNVTSTKLWRFHDNIWRQKILLITGDLNLCFITVRFKVLWAKTNISSSIRNMKMSVKASVEYAIPKIWKPVVKPLLPLVGEDTEKWNPLIIDEGQEKSSKSAHKRDPAWSSTTRYTEALFYTINIHRNSIHAAQGEEENCQSVMNKQMQVSILHRMKTKYKYSTEISTCSSYAIAIKYMITKLWH